MIIWVAAALLVGFIIGAIEGRYAVSKAQEIARAADTEAAAIKEATAHAVAQLHEHIQAGEDGVANAWAHVVATLRNAL